MPVYVYRCKKCDEVFEEKHGMSESAEKCTSCSSTKIFRVPSFGFAKAPPLSRSSKPGKIVKDFIEETRKEVKLEKKKLKEKEL